MNKVIIYTTQSCPYCIRAKNLLDSKNVAYTEINITADPSKKEEMVARSNGMQSVPQIFIGETHVGGFDKLWQLETNGQLGQLLEN